MKARALLSRRPTFARQLAAASALLLCVAQICAASPATDEAVGTLIDPRAGSNQKLSAITILQESGFAPETAEGSAMIWALTRQAHHDMPPVRQHARALLARWLGEKETEKLLAEFFIPDQGFYDDFELAMQGWPDATGLAQALGSNQSLYRRRAMDRLADLALRDYRHLPSLDAALKARLVAHLEHFDRLEPSVRHETLMLIDQLGAGRAAIVPLIFRAADDPMVSLRLFKRFSLMDPQLPEHRAIVTAIAAHLTDADPNKAGLANAYLRRATPEEVRPLVAAEVAAAAARQDLKAVELLEVNQIDPALFAQEIVRRFNKADNPRARAGLLKAMHLAGADRQIENHPQFRDTLLLLLASDDRNLSIAAAQIFVGANAQPMAIDSVVAAIKAGKTVFPEVITTLKPDPEQFSGRLLELLHSDKASVRRAAAIALSASGLKGDSVRLAIQPLLRDPDNEIRQTAARVLNTPDAIARAQIPDLIDRLRSDAPHDRHVAALQLQNLDIEPKAFTRALLRAVEDGDFAARLGLVQALEVANAAGGDPLEVLRTMAGDQKLEKDARAFARAALREVEHQTPKPAAAL